MTVHDELLTMGYGHRKYGEHVSKHEIFVISTGEIIGRYHAADAVAAAKNHGTLKAARESLPSDWGHNLNAPWSKCIAILDEALEETPKPHKRIPLSEAAQKARAPQKPWELLEAEQD